MANTKLYRIERDIEKTRAKILEWVFQFDRQAYCNQRGRE